MSRSGIYRILNNATGDYYIGSSVNIENRWRRHKNQLKTATHGNIFLLRAWEKYGENAFSIDVLETCEPSREVLLEREQHYLDALKPTYNMLPVAGSRLGSRMSERTKEKLRNRVFFRRSQTTDERGTER